MLRHYLLLAGKVLLRRKVFTLISLFGITTTLLVFIVIAAFIDHGFGPGAPETRLDRMLSVTRAYMYGPGFTMSSGGGFRLFDQYARDLPGAERLSIFSDRMTVDSFVRGAKVSVTLKRTDGEFWKVFDFSFVEGRPYGPDDVERAEHVAVVSEATRDRLVGTGQAVGQSIELDGQRFLVVGVVANVSEMRNLPFSEVWVPHSTAKSQGYRHELMGGFQAVIVARSHADMPAIQAEFNSRLSRIELPSKMESVLAPFETQFQGFARKILNDRSLESHAPKLVGVLAGLGFLLALLPTVNLVNLNISRIMERASEIGVRKAFGASSRMLVLQFVVENVLLTCVGAAAAFLLAIVVLDGINRSGMIANAQLALNVRVFLAGFALAVIFGILSGVYPAWRMSRLHPIQALKGQAA